MQTVSGAAAVERRRNCAASKPCMQAKTCSPASVCHFMLMKVKLSEKRLADVAGCHRGTEVHRALSSQSHFHQLYRLSLSCTSPGNPDKRDGRRLCLSLNDVASFTFAFGCRARYAVSSKENIGEMRYRECGPDRLLDPSTFIPYRLTDKLTPRLSALARSNPFIRDFSTTLSQFRARDN